MSEPRVRSVMTRRVECVDADADVAHALSRMAARNISCLIVLESDRPIGILTERDVVRLFVKGWQPSSETSLRDVMRSPVYSIAADLSLSEAAKMMRANGFRRFPVVDRDGKLMGIVTQTDILRGSVSAIENYSRRLEKMVDDRTEALAQKNRDLETLSITDSLTGISNRRHLYQRLEEELARSRRHGEPLACIMLDLDHFKALNDSHGHEFGDDVLRLVVRVIRGTVRKEDLLARYGGEEFVVISQCDTAGGETLANRVREAVALCSLPVSGGVATVTVSAGVAGYDPMRGPDWADELLRRADAALYRAKAVGRNTVICYQPDLEFSDVA